VQVSFLEREIPESCQLSRKELQQKLKMDSEELATFESSSLVE